MVNKYKNCISNTVELMLKDKKGADGRVKYQRYQIAALIKVSILKATYSEPVCSVVNVNAGTGAIEAQAARFCTATASSNRTGPIIAVGSTDRTSTGGAEARHGPFKRGGKSAC